MTAVPRARPQTRQGQDGRKDEGLRNAVTRGAQKVFPEFVGASYAWRYELFCRKLVLERHYTAAAFIVSERSEGPSGAHGTPARDLSVEEFGKALVAHVSRFV